MSADYGTLIEGTVQDITTPTCQEIRERILECSANVLIGKTWVSIDGRRTRDDDTAPTSASLSSQRSTPSWNTSALAVLTPR